MWRTQEIKYTRDNMQEWPTPMLGKGKEQEGKEELELVTNLFQYG